MTSCYTGDDEQNTHCSKRWATGSLRSHAPSQKRCVTWCHRKPTTWYPHHANLQILSDDVLYMVSPQTHYMYLVSPPCKPSILIRPHLLINAQRFNPWALYQRRAPFGRKLQISAVAKKILAEFASLKNPSLLQSENFRGVFTSYWTVFLVFIFRWKTPNFQQWL